MGVWGAAWSVKCSGRRVRRRVHKCTHFTRCGPPLSGKPACREGRDDCRGCCDALTCSRLSALCLSLSCGSYFRRLSARALGRGVRRLGGLYWRLIMAAYWQRTWELVSVVASARRSSSGDARLRSRRAPRLQPLSVNAAYPRTCREHQIECVVGGDRRNDGAEDAFFA